MALTDSLISWWDLEEASGARADAHGSYDLTDNNTVGSAAGKVGDAADFVAANSEYLSHPDNADFRANGSLTIACWARPDTLGGGVIAKAGPGASNEYRLEIDGAGKVEFIVGSSSVSNNNYASAGTWVFIVAEYDAGAGEATLYLDNDPNNTNTSNVGAPTTDTNAFDVGLSAGAAGNFDGLIDSVGFWKRTLTSTERDDLWNGGSGVSYSDVGGGEVSNNSLTLLGVG